MASRVMCEGSPYNLWLSTVVCAKELWLHIGILRQTPTSDITEEVREKELKKLRKTEEIVMQDCHSLGGTLDIIAEVLDVEIRPVSIVQWSIY